MMDENELYCYTCSIGFSSLVFLKEHTLSLMHHKVLDHQLKNNGTKHPNHYCFICNKEMHLPSWGGHINSPKHKHQLELMKASIAHTGSWNDPPPQHRPSSRSSSHHRNRPHSRPDSRSGSSERGRFKAAAWQATHPPPGPSSSGPPPPPHPNQPRRSFTPADSDENERRRQQDRVETEALLRRAQAMQDAFRRDRELHAQRHRQPEMKEAFDTQHVAPHRQQQIPAVRPNPVSQSNGDRPQNFERSSASDRGRPREPTKDALGLPKNSEVSKEELKLPPKLSDTRNSSILGSLSSSSIQSSPAPRSADLIRPSVRSHSPINLQSCGERKPAASSTSLLNVINSPRGRRERRQLAELLRAVPLSVGPSRRPRLNPPLSPAILRTISQHEEGAAELPTLDLSVEEATSGVTSLSTTAREETSSEQLSEDTARSGVSLVVSPVAKKRKTGQAEDLTDSQPSEPLSEEVSRMQLALQLSVQQQAVHRKVEKLNSDLSEQYRLLEALQRKIEGMELDLSKLREEESDIHLRRMEVLKKSYLKPFGTSSDASVTSASEGITCSSRMETSQSLLDHSVTSSDSQTDTVVARPVKLEQDVNNATDDTEEDSVEPLIGNLTAREIRERAMAMIGGGAMNFADLDDVLSELMVRVTNESTSDVSTELQEPQEHQEKDEQREELQRSGKKRRRHSRNGSEEQAPVGGDRRTDGESVVSDVMSARPASSRSSKRESGEKSRKKSSSSLSEDSSSSAAAPPVPTFAGVIEAHNGPVQELQLFRNCLYSCAEDGSVMKVGPQSHECMKQYSGFSECVRCLLVTEKPKGVPRIFSGGDDKMLLVHDTRSGKEMQRLPMDAQLNCMLLHWFSLYIGLGSGAVVIYDVRSNSMVRTVRISDHPVRRLHLARRESRSTLLVATSNGTVWLCDLGLSGSFQQLLPASRGGERPMHLQTVGDRLLFITDAGRLRQVSLTAASFPATAEDVAAEFGVKVCCLLAPSHAQHVLVGCRDGSIRLVNRENLTQVTKVFYTPGRFALTALAANLSGDTGSIFAGNKNGQLLILQMSTTSVACEFGDCTLTFGSRDDLVYHVTREHVLSASESDVPCLWAKSCKHRFDRARSEDISVHVRLHV